MAHFVSDEVIEQGEQAINAKLEAARAVSDERRRLLRQALADGLVLDAKDSMFLEGRR